METSETEDGRNQLTNLLAGSRLSARYPSCVSPTIFREAGNRFFFFWREEPRLHVHVQHESGEAKIWLEPNIRVARNWGLTEAIDSCPQTGSGARE